jgi:hypothetical protein
MGVESLIGILIWAVVIFIIAWVAYYVITTFMPEPIRTPILAVVGVILLIIVLYALMGGGGLPRLR